MPDYRFKNFRGTDFVCNVPSAATYVQPNAGTAGTTTVGQGGSDLFTVWDHDGEGTAVTLPGGITLYPRYRQTHFVSSYVSGQNTNNVGGVTIPNDRGYWSTAYLPTPGGSIVGGASQTVTVPGQADVFTVEAVIALNDAYLGRDDTNGHFVFGVQPDREVDIGASPWGGHNFRITYNNTSYMIDGSTFTAVSPGANTERWVTPDLGTTEWPKLRDKMLNGQTFELRIKRKT